MKYKDCVVAYKKTVYKLYICIFICIRGNIALIYIIYMYKYIMSWSVRLLI